jgi:hypothetical protein
MQFAAGKSKGDMLCVNQSGKPLGKDFRRWLDPALKEAGIENFSTGGRRVWWDLRLSLCD